MVFFFVEYVIIYFVYMLMSIRVYFRFCFGFDNLVYLNRSGCCGFLEKLYKDEVLSKVVLFFFF